MHCLLANGSNLSHLEHCINNEIYGNRDGIVLREGAQPTIEGNRIHDQRQRGIVVCARGQGSIVGNEIRDSGTYNVWVCGEEPVLRNLVPALAAR